MVTNPTDADFKVGQRASYSHTKRGTTSFGFGDVVKVNKRTVEVIDRKYPNEERILVDKALVYRLREASELVDLTLTKEAP